MRSMGTMSGVGPGRKRAARRWTYFVSAAVVLAALTACRQGDSVNPASAPPSTAAVLKLMPEGTVVAMAIPSVERAEEQIRALLLRGAPKDMDMQAEIKVITSQLARSANAFEAATVADIAAIKGIDPEKSIAIFFGGPTEGEKAPWPAGQAGVEREMMRYLDSNRLRRWPLCCPMQNDGTSKNLSWNGAARNDELERFVESEDDRVSREDGGFAYFLTDSVSAGTSAGWSTESRAHEQTGGDPLRNG